MTQQGVPADPEHSATFCECFRPFFAALDQTAVGRVSRIDALQLQHIALETARRREQRLSLIDAALGRIESGEYGFCLDCEEAIDERRLGVDPAALRCIRCAEKTAG